MTDTLTLGDVASAQPYADGISRPTSVVKAISRVMAELPAIGKEGKADPAQGGYRYRGIEQITAAAQRLMADQGVVFVPRVVSVDIVDITVNGKPWTDTRLTVEYLVYGPAGDHIVVGPLLAIGRDNSDKGANKAMTQAYKQALLQVFCVADSKDDADGTTHEADTRPTHQPSSMDEGGADAIATLLGYMDGKHAKDVNDALLASWRALPDERRDEVKAWLKARGYSQPVPVKLDDAKPYQRVLDGLPPEEAQSLTDAGAVRFAAPPAPKPKIAAVIAYAEAQGRTADDVKVLGAYLYNRPVELHELEDTDAASLESFIGDLVAGDITIANGSVVA